MISGFEELHYQLQLDGIKDMMGENSFLKVLSVVGELDIIIIAENLAVSDIFHCKLPYFWKIYTAGKNFTQALVVTVVTNFISNFMF